MRTQHPENPFVFGGLVAEADFVDRTEELAQLERDLRDREKIFLLSPRRYGKSSLVALAFTHLEKEGIHTATIPVSTATNYTEFLERFTAEVVVAAGPWEKVRTWALNLVSHLQPEITLDPLTNKLRVVLGRTSSFDPHPIAPAVFALPAQFAARGKFHMAICLDEFQQIEAFDGRAIENCLREAVQRQRQVGYVFAGSQPSIMQAMTAPHRPFYKAGPVRFLDKIPATAWEAFILRQFARRGRILTPAALQLLLQTADLVPFDVQRLAHELWDFAELTGTEGLDIREVNTVIDRIVTAEAQHYEERWEQCPTGQRSVLRAITAGGTTGIYTTVVRDRHRLGPRSTVQVALRLLEKKGILGRFHNVPCFIDPFFAVWIRKTQ